MLTYMKDWDQGARKEPHAPEDLDLEELFDNLFLDEGEQRKQHRKRQWRYCWRIEEEENL
jgi:hypothetical protein